MPRTKRIRVREYDDPEVDRLAATITEYLKRLESDPKANAKTLNGWGLLHRPFEGADARADDERPVVGIRYQDWAPRYYLDKAQARRYIKRLDRGHTGRHDE